MQEFLKNSGAIGLAPMAGVSDRALREVCFASGADFAVSEMVSAKALVMGDKKSHSSMAHEKNKAAFGIQLFGDEIEVLAQAAVICEEYEPDFIDLNAGCPAPKIVKNKGGSSLLRTPELIGEILLKMKQAVRVPVSLKMRTGYDDEHVNAVEVAQIAQQAGASFLTVHGRTRTKMYKPGVDYETIGKVKASVDIPVIGNGDIADIESFQRMQATGVDAFAIGRGAQGNPWVFGELKAYLKGEAPPVYPLGAQMDMMREQAQLICQYKGEHIGMKEARKHCAWYLNGVKKAAHFRAKSGTLSSLAELDDFIKEILAENQ